MPRTSEQNEQIRNERKDAILTAGLYIFSIKGYDGATLDDVAKAIGCSHGLLFHYYKNKKELYAALVNEVASSLIQDMLKDINFNQKAKFVMIDIANAFLKSLKSNNDQYAWAIYLLLNIDVSINTNPTSYAALKIKHKKMFEFFGELIEKGKADGDFDKTKDTKQCIVSIMAIIKGLSYARMKLGYKKFVTPDTNILMGMLY